MTDRRGARALRLEAGAGVTLLCLVVVCGVLQAKGWFARFDRLPMTVVGQMRTAFAGEIFSGFALRLSEATGVAGRLVLLAALLPVFLWRKRGRLWLWLAAVSIGAMLLNTGLKHYFQAVRPQVIDPLETIATYSFPSGHASGTMAFFGGLAMIAGSRLPWAAALALVALIGVARVWLGVHWPSDVLCGWMEGAALLLLARRFLPEYHRIRT